MTAKSIKPCLALICFSLPLIAVMSALAGWSQEPTPGSAAGAGQVSPRGGKSTVFRFEKLRAGAFKTEQGWNAQDFATSFFNPNPLQITVTMTLVSNDPKFIFANGKVGTYTKT